MKMATIFMSLVLGFSSVGLASNSSSNPLVVVTVEDTLKLSHSLNFWDSLNYVHDSESRFLGMNKVLNLLVSYRPATSLIYLTEPSELLAGSVQVEFLKKNSFPRGHFLSYKEATDVSHRLEILRNAMAIFKPAKVVLIGHNGGVDVEVFQSLAQGYPEVEFYQYLHVLYSPNSQDEAGHFLSPFQRGYVTAVELLIDLQQKRLVEANASTKLAKELTREILFKDSNPESKVVGIPSFAKCEVFIWSWDVLNRFSFLAPLKEHLSKRCYSSPAYEN
ncbi:MAG: hypothetical protein IPM97_05830 [Bdellovibrionaceae bacterium]|nr:hypothetical protein [Pseudobdellovibrionaceae bacterium]